jgi:broad specificity phosphatase PhoE
MTTGDNITAGGRPGRLQIYMLRHGRPEFPDGRSYVYGRTDYPLSREGGEQAKRVGEALADIPMRRIISSDLVRAIRTAEIVAGIQRVQLCHLEQDAGLREINMGEWDGRTKEEIKEGYVDIFRDRGYDVATVSAPGGESFSEAQERGLAAFKRIVESSRGLDRILIVAHGAVMWSMVAGLFELRLSDIYRFGLDYCALHLLEYSEIPAQWGQYRLVRYNWSPDLARYMDDLV